MQSNDDPAHPTTRALVATVPYCTLPACPGNVSTRTHMLSARVHVYVGQHSVYSTVLYYCTGYCCYSTVQCCAVR